MNESLEDYSGQALLDALIFRLCDATRIDKIQWERSVTGWLTVIPEHQTTNLSTDSSGLLTLEIFNTNGHLIGSCDSSRYTDLKMLLDSILRQKQAVTRKALIEIITALEAGE